MKCRRFQLAAAGLLSLGGRSEPGEGRPAGAIRAWGLRFRVQPVLPDSHVDREWDGQRGDPFHPLAHEFRG